MKITTVSLVKFAPKKYPSHITFVFNPLIQASRLVFDEEGGKFEIKTPREDDMNRRKLMILIRELIQESKRHRLSRIVIPWEPDMFEKHTKNCEDFGELLAINLEMAEYSFTKYKTPPKEGFPSVKEVVIVIPEKRKKELERGIRKGRIIGQATSFCRDLANMTGEEMTPSTLVHHVKDEIKNSRVKMTVLDERTMRRRKMGGVIGVGKGSYEESKFIILNYQGAGKRVKPIVFVGKGVTFDTGGLNLKPGAHMDEMAMDMSGGAAVAAAVIAAAKIGLKRNIYALIPAVENMPSGRSYRPGDILEMMSGTKVEVKNTDAEGRIILGDALTFAQKYKPQLVVDVATLTGAAMVALGERASAIFTQDDKLEDQLRDLGEQTGDYVWPLPIWDEYDDDIKGIHGDIVNTKSKGDERMGGSIMGAIFLKHFAKDFDHWAHIDIAPRMTTIPDDKLAKGAAGTPVRLLVKLIEETS